MSSHNEQTTWWERPGAAGENRTEEQYHAKIRALKEPNPALVRGKAVALVTEDDGSGDIISPDSVGAERIYAPAFIAGWKARHHGEG